MVFQGRHWLGKISVCLRARNECEPEHGHHYYKAGLSVCQGVQFLGFGSWLNLLYMSHSYTCDNVDEYSSAWVQERKCLSPSLCLSLFWHHKSAGPPSVKRSLSDSERQPETGLVLSCLSVFL